MSQDRVMLLIDADNVSVDVMEQSVRLLLNQHGALHVRRAYCTAEGAVKHQAAFKRLGIKPMVNLAAGKNSTDIALAVDAVDLVLAERPDVVVIASSDSDFAPLVQRLREKGCVVRGIGQLGKTGAETQDVYDDYTVLEHKSPRGAARPATQESTTQEPATPARKTRARKTTPVTAAQPAEVTKAPAGKAAPAKKAAAKKAAAKRAVAGRPEARAQAPAPATATAEAAPLPAVATPAPPDAAESAAEMPAAGKARRKRSAGPASVAAVAASGQPQAAAAAAVPALVGQVLQTLVASETAAEPAPAQPAAQPSPQAGLLPHELARRIMGLLPELGRGETVQLGIASQRLREAGLLSKSSSSTRLLGRFPELFELMPAGQPNQLRLRR
jgi:uncharacterized protein (TIGR00288 family)